MWEAGSIELAEHTHTRCVLKRMNIEGRCLRGDDAYKTRSSRRARVLGSSSGTIDRLGVEVMLAGVSLDEWGPSSVPGRLRPFVEMLGRQGGSATRRSA